MLWSNHSLLGDRIAIVPVGILDEASPERTRRLVSDEVVPLLLAQDTPVRKAPGLLAPQPVALEKE